MDKVSIIIPVYNAEKYINECINSVLNQTYKKIEIIVVNDHSSDKSIKIVKSLKDKRIKIYNSKKNGVSSARNLGIDKSTGKYICFLDSDDFWEKNHIEKTLNFIKENNYAFVFNDYNYVDYKGKILKRTNAPKLLDYNAAIKNTCIFTSSVMLNMTILKKEDIYMPNIQIGQDSVTWWNILKKGYKAYKVNDNIVNYRLSKKSLSSNKIKSVIGAWKSYKSQNLPFIKRVYCFCCYIINAIKRRPLWK